MYFWRAFLVWLMIICVESVHGALRQAFLAPLIGDFPARRISLFTGMLLIFLIACIFIRWIRAENAKHLFAVGFLWAGLTLVFEFALGFLVLGYSRERVFEDYDLLRGGLMGFGIIFMFFVPYLAARLRGTETRKSGSF